MPLAGSLDVRSLLTDAPLTTVSDAQLHLEDVDILQVLYEVRVPDRESLVPPALNPTIPPVVSFLVYRAKDSQFGPFALAQVRLTARAGVRPRAYLVSARCDNEALAAALRTSWGFRITPGDVALHRYFDRVDCRVSEGGGCILDVSLVDPHPVTGHDIQYPPGMHLARIERDGERVPRLIQVDSAAWGDERLVAHEPVSASFAAASMTIADVHYVCNPDIPASEGTEKVGNA